MHFNIIIVHHKLSNRLNFRLSNVFRMLGIIFLAFFVFSVVRSIMPSRRNLIGNKGTINIIYDNPVSIASYDLEDKVLSIIYIPKDVELNLPYGFGSYRAGVVSELGEQEGKGAKLLADGVMLSMGIGIDGWIQGVEGTGGFQQSESGISKLSLKKRINQIVGGNSNLSLIDRLRLFWMSQELNAGEIKYIDLADLNAFKSSMSPDGEKLSYLDKSKILAYQSHLFRDRMFSDEGLSVSVLNATSVPSLAQGVSQVLQISGIKVVSEDTSFPSRDRCQIKGAKNLEKSYTTRKITNWFNCEFVKVEDESRSDLTIILGDEYSQYLMGGEVAN